MVVPEQVGDLDAVKLEESLMQTWKVESTFQQQVDSRRSGKPFIFLEGPPTANGKPGIHHVVARTYKDLVCRWKAMEGFLVERKGGWDTHGLPVEIEVQKRLDLMSNQDIVEFGIEAFNDECRSSVWTYEDAWRKMTERMAFWVDMDDPYITLHDDYIESCWWALSEMFNKKLLFRGYKVLPFCPQTGTSYSTHEVALGYKEVEEPSVYIKFKLKDEDTSILAWTTTPWTLPGNVGLAVGPDVDYIRVRISSEPEGWEGRGSASVGEELILAKDLFKEVIRHHCDIISEMKGSELLGMSYEPLFPGAVERGDSKTAWTILEADWVTTSDGTGVVHTAVMYGEDDYNLGMEVGLPAEHTVDMGGNFVSGVHPELDGRYVKDCDDAIIDLLAASGQLYREKMYVHDYPHCWRTGHPLLYYAMDSWFVQMTAVKERLLEFNEQIEWAPENIGTGRFGEWLRNVKDWAISRERFWGTPLPVWICVDCSHQHCIGSKDELQKMMTTDSQMPRELHRPYVDEVKLNCPECGENMQREQFVMDCWFDSGCASFAQWHHPFDGGEAFKESFPVDYICEGVDQTRGWFYTLLAVSTTVFDQICYKRCLSLGLIMDKEGKKMSKSKGNVVDPWDHFNREGADASRWYMVSAGAPWSPLKFDPAGVRETYARFFLTLWNVYRFHADYAALDNFDPSASKMEDRSLLDRWVLSRTNAVANQFHEMLVGWDIHKAARLLEDFVVDDLSNWYVRRSRRRLWDENESSDKASCQHTLHEVLTIISRLVAPISPFMVDSIHRNLHGTSVHLTDWPVNDSGSYLPPRDMVLEARMDLVRQLAEMGRRIRVDAKRRQRLPCAEGWVVGGPDLEEMHDLLAEELNVETISIEEDLDRFQRVELQPNRKALGRKARQDLPTVLEALAALPDHEVALDDIKSGRMTISGYLIEEEDVEVRRVERPGYSALTIEISENELSTDVSLVLDMSIDDALLSKGLAREIIRRIQSQRKEMDMDMEASIKLEVWLGEECPELVEYDWAHLRNETRASHATMHVGEGPADAVFFDVDGANISFKIN